jgi:VanZ family protein
MDTRRLLDKFVSYLKHYRAAVIWAAFLLIISLVPGTRIPTINFWDWNIGDKLAHIAVYFIMGVSLIYGSYKHSGFARPKWIYLFVFPTIALIYGLVMELFQLWFTTTRYASAGDALANGIGAVLGTVIAFSFFKSRSR